MNLKFPENFYWGAATSGPQSEGRFNKKHANIFDHWYEKEPEKFYNQVGPDVASNFYNSYREDIQLMKKIGLNSVRISIQWTRLIDDFETASINKSGMDYYNNVIDELIANGIQPFINLHHFDLPVELYHKYGGWESKFVGELFVKFAEQCFKLFGDRVTEWFTHNEPMVVVDGQYLYQFHYPNIVDGKKAVQVAYNLQLVSSKTVEKFKEVNKNPDGRIGIILNLTPSYPASDSKDDQEAAKIANLWINQLFLDPSVLGEYPSELLDLLDNDGVLFDYTNEELDVIKNNTVDLLGVNFYHPHRVKHPDVSPNSLRFNWLPNKYYDEFQMPGRRMNIDRGWEIYPEALYDIALNIRDNYNNITWFVAENGMGVSNEHLFEDSNGVVQDDYRINFIIEHLKYLHKGILEGSNCIGYHLWTPIDCWSWTNAYKNRYGFISNNIHTQIKTIKKSGYWFKDVAENNKVSLK